MWYDASQRIERAARAVAGLCVVWALAVSPRDSAGWQDDGAARYDWILVGGTVHDGSGGEPVVADVAIRSAAIAAIGDLKNASAGRRVDCSGLWIAPGFIDLHNHSDRPIVGDAARANVNYLTQGCTTIVTGNCGSGPVNAAEYFETIERLGAGTNVAHLLPHGSLRTEVMGQTNREPTSDELERMRGLADQAMRDGAFGMSTGLIYIPGSFAKTDELIEIAKVVGRHGGFYASHMRSESEGLLDAVEETLRIGRESGAAVHISHFKASGKDAWGLLRSAASLVESARERGGKVTADQYPYTASSTSLEATLLPAWAREGGRSRLAERLKDPPTRARIRDAVAAELPTRGRIQIASFRGKPEWVGKSLDAIAESTRASVADTVLAIEDQGGASIVHFGMQDEEMRFAMGLPWVATASDGSSRIPSDEQPHPRSFGTFSRKIGRYAIAESHISVPLAVRSCSGLPADILGLTDRGYLRTGMAADIVVIDPRDFRDQATYDEPFRYSTGVCYAFVNGVPAIHDRLPTGALGGVVLRRTAQRAHP
ncbi:MAG: amidohydrolase family protein [Planctomycetes bacterium]|nr:amidohydrolase family protein [Planctomycetota bacterium]